MKKLAILLALVAAPAFADTPKADKAPAADKTADKAPAGDSKDAKTDTKATAKATDKKATDKKATDKKAPATKDAPKADAKAPAKS
jgi:hypothetical protein